MIAAKSRPSATIPFKENVGVVGSAELASGCVFGALASRNKSRPLPSCVGDSTGSVETGTLATSRALAVTLPVSAIEILGSEGPSACEIVSALSRSVAAAVDDAIQSANVSSIRKVEPREKRLHRKRFAAAGENLLDIEVPQSEARRPSLDAIEKAQQGGLAQRGLNGDAKARQPRVRGLCRHLQTRGDAACLSQCAAQCFLSNLPGHLRTGTTKKLGLPLDAVTSWRRRQLSLEVTASSIKGLKLD